MAVIAGLLKPTGEVSNFPGSFRLYPVVSTVTLVVTGDMDPDCRGHYPQGDLWNGEPTYVRPDGAFTFWATSPPDMRIISAAPGTWHGNAWGKYIPITGDYNPIDTATGTPVVAWQPGAITRIRIHGRRGGSGSPPGLYHGSPRQQAAREAFATVTRHYVEKPEEHAALITGVLTPDITGWYGIVNPFADRDCWARVQTGFTVWWDDETPCWIISANPGIQPGPDVDSWIRLDPDPVGIYTSFGTADGDATLAYE